jgi:hypothetical protein
MCRQQPVTHHSISGHLSLETNRHGHFSPVSRYPIANSVFSKITSLKHVLELRVQILSFCQWHSRVNIIPRQTHPKLHLLRLGQISFPEHLLLLLILIRDRHRVCNAACCRERDECQTDDVPIPVEVDRIAGQERIRRNDTADVAKA